MRVSRPLTVLSAAGAAVLLLAVPAAAHVTVSGPGATQGGYAKITFRVPTEGDSPTVKLAVTFPADQPLAYAATKPQPGWTAVVKKVKPAEPLKDDEGNTIDSVVSTITWTATNGGIPPGQFDEFDVSAGALPDSDEMVFKAVQTYKNGTVVRWIETPAPGSTGEPEHPAPTLQLAPAAATSPTATPSEAASSAASGAPTVSVSSSSDDSTAKALGGTGLGLGIVAVLLAVVALVRSGRSSKSL
jgi:uncharacterized protein YcnI